MSRAVGMRVSYTLLVVLALGWGPIFPAAGADLMAGATGIHYGDVLESPSGNEPESKLWWNDGAWWASLYQESERAYHVYEFDAQAGQWVDTGVPLDDRPESRADVLWDGRHLYVLSHVFIRQGRAAETPADLARLYRLSYDRMDRRYAPDPGFPVNVAPAKAETFVLAKDSTGRLWVTYVQDGNVMVNRTLGSDLIWGNPFVLPASGATVGPSDAAALVPFAGNKIGLVWTNELENAVYFTSRADCAPEAEWGATQVALKAPGVVSDQLSVKSIRLDGQGWVYAAAKTGQGQGGDAIYIWLLTRQPNGRWTGQPFGVARQSHQRPTLALDADRRQLYMFAAAPWNVTGQAIYYKVAGLPAPSFRYGLGTEAISMPGGVTPDSVTSTKQNIGAATGMIVLGSDDATRTYVYNYLLPADPAQPTPSELSLAGASPPATCSSR